MVKFSLQLHGQFSHELKHKTKLKLYFQWSQFHTLSQLKVTQRGANCYETALPSMMRKLACISGDPICISEPHAFTKTRPKFPPNPMDSLAN